MTKKQLIQENEQLKSDIKNLVIYNEDTIPTYIQWVTTFQMEEETERLKWVTDVIVNKNFNGFEALLKNKTKP